MSFANGSPKNPRRVAAGQKNGRLRRSWGPEDRQRQRLRALASQPWRFSTGPRTLEGKRRASRNGLGNHQQAGSTRQVKAEVADVTAFIGELAALRRDMLG